MASHQAAYMAHHQHQQLAPHQQLPPPPSYVSSSSSQHSHHYPALPSMTQQPNQMSMPPQASSSSSSSAAAAAPASTPGRTLLTDQQELQEKNLTPFSRKDKKGWIYSLHVVQQPQRARMCGFGDKDRRPITPPPCVRLVIKDAATDKEVDVNEIEHNMYILNVDLWSEDALREVNLVRSTTATPSISSTTPVSFQAMEQGGGNSGGGGPSPGGFQQMMAGRDGAYMSQSQSPSGPYHTGNPYPGGGYPSHASNGGAGGPYAAHTNGTSGQYPNHYYPQAHDGYGSHAASGGFGPPLTPGGGGYDQNGGLYSGQGPPRMSMSAAGQPQGMFTRNLIGSLAASAFRLTDSDDRIGIWFVLGDLSVRTEGQFRLRFSFVDLSPIAAPSSPNTPCVNRESAPVLACTFSEVFHVFSAKKFPGVCESTQLSKCFATQGIKIPIRKDNQNAKGAGDDDDDY